MSGAAKPTDTIARKHSVRKQPEADKLRSQNSVYIPRVDTV